MGTGEAIDFVVTWVDGGDEKWQENYQKYLAEERKYSMTKGAKGVSGEHHSLSWEEKICRDSGKEACRFRDWGLLRYWFRGVETFAPWVRRIFFVTCGQCPHWLNQEHPRIRLVNHQDYIPKEYLPTFNSNVIELYIHRIPDLGERFVLFNDDMYLTAPVRPEDFFIDDLPLESALLDTITADEPGNMLPYSQVNNFSIINKHFCKQEVLKVHRRKFFTMKYGKDLMRNALLSSFKYFSCFRDSHLPTSYCKDIFERVWTEEKELLEASGMGRFRSRDDYSHWLMKAWYICEGDFVPRSCAWGRHYELHEDHFIGKAIEKQQYHAICLNDSRTDLDFAGIQSELETAFQRILPNRSAFELY